MSDRPRILCRMTSSIDGGLHPSRYTDSPDGTVKDWTGIYEDLHDRLHADGWIVGRVTMAEMAKGDPTPATGTDTPPRPHLFQRRDAAPYAITLDRAGKLRFAKGDVGGDHFVVLLGSSVGDAHLAELAANGVSYIVSDSDEIDLPVALATLRHDLGIETLLLEGGSGINGTFLAAGLVDEFSIVLTPTLDGAAGAERIVATPDGLRGKVTLSLIDCERLAAGAVHLRYAVRPAQ
ncbi:MULTISPECIES: dihydrofolate reductase family protein [unclassified Sphingomonas]|uniref:dihydrofolate reductase family protein n=1 Tax=unclassified Sphingomonas TaxID=196159 RepID=UPI0006FC2F46|nr:MULTISPECIES: dihydrofolate reductase family protein [unclassified Sphingomonas]KQM28185.1 riboflavin deaminase [Sphingomonas sp. Leaf9]KQM44527.1 riboflavin deaminase [Sphingomonas sp. Leaf11]